MVTCPTDWVFHLDFLFSFQIVYRDIKINLVRSSLGERVQYGDTLDLKRVSIPYHRCYKYGSNKVILP